jgi:ribosome-associated protein
MTKKPHNSQVPRNASVKGSPPAIKGKPRSVKFAERSESGGRGPAGFAGAEDEPPAPPATTEGLDGAMRALALALDKKALEPVLLDVRGLCSYCNYQLVVSGRSDRQVDAIADGIVVGLKLEDMRPLGAEAARTGQWSLLDYGDFVVHVFLHAAREHYDLEGLWNDAPRIPLDIPADARLPAGEAYDLAP